MNPQLASKPSLFRQIVEGIQAVVIWCLCALILVGLSYGCSRLTYEPGFAMEQECLQALSSLQYREGHHGEDCEELENGHWKIFDLDGNAL